MNLSNLVHDSRRRSAYPVYQTPQTPQTSYTSQSQSQPSFSHMSSTMASQPHTRVQQSSYDYSRSPQPPPSPPVDEFSKCSLPSISSLLQAANPGKDSGVQYVKLPLTTHCLMPVRRIPSSATTATATATAAGEDRSRANQQRHASSSKHTPTGSDPRASQCETPQSGATAHPSNGSGLRF